PASSWRTRRELIRFPRSAPRKDNVRWTQIGITPACVSLDADTQAPPFIVLARVSSPALPTPAASSLGNGVALLTTSDSKQWNHYETVSTDQSDGACRSLRCAHRSSFDRPWPGLPTWPVGGALAAQHCGC